MSMDLSYTARMCLGALGYLPRRRSQVPPEVDFELAAELEQLDAVRLAPADEWAVAAQIGEAFEWCAARFPLCLRIPAGEPRAGDANRPKGVVEDDCDGSHEDRAIGRLKVARSARPGEYVTASSPHRLQQVFIAAPWPLSSPFRLASLFVHEAMHQGLYLRERSETPARPGSLAYSPWKGQLRPGRLVWHSFWTFMVQFAFLAEAFARETEVMLSADPGLPDFLADMDSRIACCAQSLAEFEILQPAEAARVDAAGDALAALAERLDEATGGYCRRRAAFAAEVNAETERWSEAQIAARFTLAEAKA